MKKFLKKTEGFTLVELIVVIAILGILAGVGTVGYSGYIKKANMAADQVLLDSLNTAYAVACIENGYDPKDTNASPITIDNGTIEEADLVVTSEKADDIEEAFWKYYEGGTFKVMTSLNFVNGKFVDAGESVSVTFAGVTITLSAQDIKNFKGSAFADVGSDNLLTMLGMASGMIDMNNNTSTLAALAKSASAEAFLFKNLGVNNGEEIYAKLQTMYPQGDMDDDDYWDMLDGKYNEIYANNAVLYAAKNSQSVSEGIWDILKAENVKEAIKANTNTEQQLAQSAMAFAMYSAYTKTDSLEGVQLTDVYNTLDSDEFKAYLEKDEAKDDLNGYLSAMNMVNDGVASGNAAATEVLMNGFTSDALSDLMDEVLGKQ